MTNLERWRFYMKDKVAPESFIEMSFYAMINAALQRRVWTGSYDMPLFPNMYIVLVAGPGIGKGIVIKPVKELLESIYIQPKTKNIQQSVRDSAEILAEQYAKAEEAQEHAELTGDTSGLKDLAQFLSTKDRAKYKEANAPLPTIPHTADCTTFEALIRDQAKAIRRIFTGKKDKFCPSGHYTSNPLTMLVEEMATMFRKKHEDLIRYFLTAFDCGNFEYKTKHQGEDIIKFLCLNILAGTNPGFMRDSVNARVIEEGFAARTIFVYENAKRFERFDQATVNEEQLKAKAEVREHIVKLTTLYGQLEYTPEAYEFLKNYVEQVLPVSRANIDPNLVHYYARKNIHVGKMATAVHFADKTDLVITLEECQKALEILDRLETKMHYALSVGVKNNLTKQASYITDYLKKYGRPCPYKLIYFHLVTEKDMDKKVIEECMHFLLTVGQITKDNSGQYTLIKEKAL